MPAKSESQQKLFGLALSVKRGDVPRSKVTKKVLDLVDKVSEKDLEDFASTTHDKLPKKVGEGIEIPRYNTLESINIVKLRRIVRDAINEMLITNSKRSSFNIRTEAAHGYQDSNAGYIKRHKNEYKMAEMMNTGNEKEFYQKLDQLESQIGQAKLTIFISNALRGYNVDMYYDPLILNLKGAKRALFLLSK